MTVKLAPSAVRSGISGAERALPCNPRASREARRGFHNLRHQVEMTVAGTLVWLHGADLTDFDTYDLRGFCGRPLRFLVALAAPRDQRPSDAEQRCRILDH